MNINRICTIAFMLLLCTSYTFSQFTINEKAIVYDKLSNTYMVSIPENAFEKDYPATIILDNESAWSNLIINGEKVQDAYIFQNVEANKEYEIQAKKGEEVINTKLTFTFLPILSIEGTFGYDYATGKMSIFTSDTSIPQTIFIKAKWRGGTTNSPDRHKRNYKIKTLNVQGKSQDISFLGMREDNNWILDAGQVDLFRLRNRIATELWNDFSTKPYYADKEPKAKTGVAGEVVEMILNNEYRGIYSLTEVMDRKELKLKKYNDKNKEFHGQLWKVSSWDKARFWSIDQDYDNTEETWHAFETKYPDIEDVNPTDYSLLYNAINFVANSDDETFKREVGEYFDIPVLIDYQIFTELLNAIDNDGKNMYWAVYDKTNDKKLTLAVWDLDATVGQDWHCSTPLHPDYVQPNKKMGIKDDFNLFYRLSSLDVNNYNKEVNNRYQQLRSSYLNEANLINRYQTYYEKILKSGAAKREETCWSQDSDIGGYPLNFKNEMEYIKDWIVKRLEFLDSQKSPLLTSIKGITYYKEHMGDNKIFNIIGQEINSNYKGIKIIKQ